MNRLSRAVCCGAAVLCGACTTQERRDVPERSPQMQTEYETAVRQMVQSVAYIGEPLKGLSEEQMASLGGLLALTRVVARAEALGVATDAALEAFWTEVDGICPPMPQPPEFRYGNCLDEEIAYVAALARCRDEGKSEEECEREAGGELGAAVMCRMGQLEALRGVIGRIPGRRWPPGPFPWPVTGVVPTGGRP